MAEARFRSVKQEVRATLGARTELATWLRSSAAETWQDGLTRHLVQNPGLRGSMDGAIRVLMNSVSTATPFFVEDEMVDVIEAASGHSSFPAYDFSVAEMPCPVGFVLLPRPIPFKAIAGLASPEVREGPGFTEGVDYEFVTIPVIGFFWDGITAKGRPLNRSGIPRVNEELEPKFVAWTLIDPSLWMQYNGSSNVSIDADVARTYPKVFPSGHVTLPFGASGWAANTGQDTPEHEMRLLKTLWLLMGQRISESKTIPGPKHEREKAERKGRPVPEVTVVTLRKMQATSEYDREHGAREYSHRFIVGGHWRVYKDERYSERLRSVPQWISPYVKGDPEKPLVVKQKVYRLAR